ncbi:3TM-type holin [Nitrosomonas communis]|uniref:3TM-type holin n=1 Tax=Nitrosomonas communis TaxID=44574 RepID=UPI003D2A5E8B
MWQLLFPAITPIINKVLDLIPNENERARAREQLEGDLQKAINQAAADQREINKIEAGHSSVFVAGWRPGIGWVCVLGCAWVFFIQPVATWSIHVFNLPVESLPSIQTDYLMELVLAMLGLSVTRTWEKAKGISR